MGAGKPTMPDGQAPTLAPSHASEQPGSELSARGRLTWPKEARACSSPPTCSRFLKEVQLSRVRGLADDASSAATKQVLKFPGPEMWDGGGQRREMQSGSSVKVIPFNSGP